jgi:hypothetical protein
MTLMTDSAASRTETQNRTSGSALRRETRGYWQELAETIGESWNRFWFTPADPLPLCLLRIGVGLLAAVYFFSYTGDLVLWFGPDGMLPMENVEPLVRLTPDAPLHRFSIFYGLESPSALYAAHWTFVVLALLFSAGLLTRVTGVLTAIGVLSYIHRVPILSSPSEPVLSMLLIYLVIGPAGRYYALDRWLFKRSEKSATDEERSLTANLALRLIQVHFAALVLAMALAKLNSYAWWEGEAVWNLLAQTISRPIDQLARLRPYTFLINAWTHAIVYFELAFPVLIWNRLARPLMIGLGVLVWLSISLLTGMAMFSAAMILASLCYIPGKSWRLRGLNPR